MLFGVFGRAYALDHGINDSQAHPDVESAHYSRYAAAAAHVRSFTSVLVFAPILTHVTSFLLEK